MIGQLILIVLLGTSLAFDQKRTLNVNCFVDVTLTYSSDPFQEPKVTCTPSCDKDPMTWFQQRLYYHDDVLKENYDKMVEANFNKDGDVECHLIPSTADADIRAAENEILEKCLPSYEPGSQVTETPEGGEEHTSTPQGQVITTPEGGVTGPGAGTTPEGGVTGPGAGTTPEGGITGPGAGTTPEGGITGPGAGTTPEGGVSGPGAGTTPEGGVTEPGAGTTPEGGVTGPGAGTTPEGGITGPGAGTTPEGGVTGPEAGTTPEGGVTEPGAGTTPEGGVTGPGAGTTPEGGITGPGAGTTPEGGVTGPEAVTTPEGGVTGPGAGTTPEGGVTGPGAGTTPEGGVTEPGAGTTPEGGVTGPGAGTTPEGGITGPGAGTTPEGGVTGPEAGTTPEGGVTGPGAGTTPEGGVTGPGAGTTPEGGITGPGAGTTPEGGITGPGAGTTPEGGVTSPGAGTTPEGGVTGPGAGTTPEGGITGPGAGTTPEGGITGPGAGTTPEGGVTSPGAGTTPEGGVTGPGAGTTPEGGITGPGAGTTPEGGITVPGAGTTPEGGVTGPEAGTTPEGGVTGPGAGTTPEGGVTGPGAGTTPEGGVTEPGAGTTPEGGVTGPGAGTTPEGGVTGPGAGTTPEGGITGPGAGTTPEGGVTGPGAITTPGGGVTGPVGTPVPGKQCEEGYEFIEELDKCFSYSNYTAQWFDAECACAAEGAVLAKVDTAEKQAILKRFLTESAWIGLNDREEEGIFFWRDGSPLVYSSWGDGQPSNKGYYNDEDCVELSADLDFNWNDEGCSAQRRFLCESVEPDVYKKITSAEVCPDGWIMNKDAKKCYHISPRKVTWGEGKNYCIELEGSLAAFRTIDEMKYAIGYLKENVWIGLNDQKVEGVYRYIDETSLSFTSWASGQPSNSGSWYLGSTGEDCTIMSLNSGFKWDDVSCTSTSRALCWKNPEVFPRKQCPNSWHADLYDTCYKMSTYATYYEDAVQKCSVMAVESHLLAPVNKIQNDYVANTVTENIWLGINDKEIEGSFKTTNGAWQTYFNWDSYEPNNLLNEDCVEMDESGAWNDESCDKNYHFICATPQSAPIPDDVVSEAGGAPSRK